MEAADPGRRAAQLYGASVIAGATLPSAAAGYIAIGVFTVLVPPGGGEDAVAGTTLETDRRYAVDKAWEQEAARVRNGQPGTVNWTADERRQLHDTGRVSGYQGHHINDVHSNPTMARDPNNIRFEKRSTHFESHQRNWRNSTKGPLIKR